MAGCYSHTYRSPGLLSNDPHSPPPFIRIQTRDKIVSSVFLQPNHSVSNFSFDPQSNSFKRMYTRHFALKWDSE